METVEKIEELQKAADYHLVRRTLRWSVLGSIMFGLTAVGFGIASIKEDPLNVVMALIGAFLFIEGIWLIAAPRPRRMIADAIALGVLGVWNIGAATVLAREEFGTIIFAIVGAAEIFWGFQSFGRYRRFSDVSIEKPSKESAKYIAQVLRSVSKAKPSQSDDIIRFEIGGFAGNLWKGKLSGDLAIFTTLTGNDLLFARRNEVEFVKKGKVRIGNTLKVTIKIGRRSFSGTIPPFSMQRYESWKGA